MSTQHPSSSPPAAARTLVVDAANVVGARPDGWWKDRAGAAARLLDALVRARGHAELRGRRVVVVLEGRAADVGGAWEGLDLVRAERDGDSTVVQVVAAATGDVLVVTSDRELRGRVEELGSQVRGAGWLRDLLDAPTSGPPSS